jgi:hypothetical protein
MKKPLPEASGWSTNTAVESKFFDKQIDTQLVRRQDREAGITGKNVRFEGEARGQEVEVKKNGMNMDI